MFSFLILGGFRVLGVFDFLFDGDSTLLVSSLFDLRGLLRFRCLHLFDYRGLLRFRCLRFLFRGRLRFRCLHFYCRGLLRFRCLRCLILGGVYVLGVSIS